jgi:AraC-like DNA-binding protein
MTDAPTAISLEEAVPLLALGPCLFAVAFLWLACRPRAKALIPSLYFLSLAASFAMPLLPLIEQEDPTTLFGVQMVSAAAPALCYLLVLSLISRRSIPFGHWLILSAPLVGEASLIYRRSQQDRFCLANDLCVESASALMLYHVLLAAFIFLLLILQVSRHGLSDRNEAQLERRHAYWLIVTLVMLHLALPILDLGRLTQRLTEAEAYRLALLLRISFLYLVLTSLFRVYGAPLQVAMESLPTLARAGRPPLDDAALAEKLTAIMRHEAPYRTPSFSREDLARLIKVSEQTVSRVLNQHLGQNFSEYVNSFRLEEAKRRLASENSAVNVIAFTAGFNSIASFNRVFKQATGLSPTQYRQQHGTAGLRQAAAE